MRMKPVSSITATSPVANQPSFMTLAVSSSAFQ
jgi:hypothetical protein